MNGGHPPYHHQYPPPGWVPYWPHAQPSAHAYYGHHPHPPHGPPRTPSQGASGPVTDPALTETPIGRQDGQPILPRPTPQTNDEGDRDVYVISTPESNGGTPTTSGQPASKKRKTDKFTDAMWDRTQKYTDEGVAELRKQWEIEWAGKPMPPPPPEIYKTRDEAIESARAFGKKHGYTINICGTYKGDDGEFARMQLKCKYGGLYRNKKQVSMEDRKRQRFTRKTNCPMKIRIQKRRFSTEWIVCITDGKHNHAPDTNVSNVPPSDYPEIEAALHEWHTAEIAKGETPHGNTLKSRALALFAESPEWRGKEPPNLDRQWLDHYRMRYNIPGKVMKPSGPPELVDWDDPEAAAAATANLAGSNPQVGREGTAFEGISQAFEDEKLWTGVRNAAKTHMQRYDGSHDWDHILRVVHMAKKIMQQEGQPAGPLKLDAQVVYLAALCHDLGDAKYAEPGEILDNQIAELLLENGATAELALKVQLICRNVSYSNEVKNPRLMKAVLDQHPELGIVQDADRLDAIGAIGIGRTFTFTGAKKPDCAMTETIAHFSDKLERLENLMKTRTGKQFAYEKTRRLKLFRTWWDEEYELVK